MKTQISTVLLIIIFLAACASPQTIPVDAQNTAMTIVGTYVSLIQTALLTATLVYPTPSPLPTQPPVPILMPDAIQVERWKEYQTELARSIFPNDSTEWFLCEWDILGHSGQEVYVWAVCGVSGRSGSAPAVIRLNRGGSILSVEIPWDWSVENIHEMFPEDVRNKFDYMEAGEIQKMSEHLEWRWAHPGEPPLIVLDTTPVVTPIP